MKKQIIIIRTKAVTRYAERIAKEIKKLGIECSIVFWKEIEDFLERNKLGPEKTLLHYRAAGKSVNPRAFNLEKKGYKLINPAKVLERTSDKYKTYERLKDQNVVLPITKKGTRGEIKKYIDKLSFNKFVLKPINSKYQGKMCFRSYKNDPEIDLKLSRVPGKEIILQEFVEYLKIYRVILVGEKIIKEAVFCDEPNENHWKVSVCLNPEIKHVQDPDPELLNCAKKITKILESEIAFVDIFQTKEGYVLSEVNTACNLSQHEDKSGYNISKDIAEYLVNQLN